jgi:hypothetical protein
MEGLDPFRSVVGTALARLGVQINLIFWSANQLAIESKMTRTSGNAIDGSALGSGGTAESYSNNPDRELVPREFVEALCWLTSARYPPQRDKRPLAERLSALLEKHVAPHASRKETDEFRALIGTSGVRKVMVTYRPVLHVVFRAVAAPPAIKEKGAGRRESSMAGTKEIGGITLSAFVALIQSLQIDDAVKSITPFLAKSIFNWVQVQR